MTQLRVYRLKHLVEMFEVSETTLRRWMKEAGFPQPRQLGPRAVAWEAAKVQEWFENRPLVGDDTKK